MANNAKRHDKEEIQDFLEKFNKDKLNFNLDVWISQINGNNSNNNNTIKLKNQNQNKVDNKLKNNLE